MTPPKIIKDVPCKGTLPDTKTRCGEIIYQTDGEFLMVGGLVVNPELNRQKVVCDKCGYRNVWTRNREFLDRKK